MTHSVWHCRRPLPTVFDHPAVVLSASLRMAWLAHSWALPAFIIESCDKVGQIFLSLVLPTCDIGTMVTVVTAKATGNSNGKVDGASCAHFQTRKGPIISSVGTDKKHVFEAARKVRQGHPQKGRPCEHHAKGKPPKKGGCDWTETSHAVSIPQKS